MPRSRKDARILNIKLASDVYDRLDIFCEETGMTKTKAVEKILNQYFDSYFKKPESKRILFKD